jgi:hypothetical protein
MSYTRPTGSNVVGTFSSAYTRPAGGSVNASFSAPMTVATPYPQDPAAVDLVFQFPTATGATGLTVTFNDAAVFGSPQDFAPAPGADSAEFGEARVRDPRILGVGFDATEFGMATTELGTPVISPEGWDSLEFGEAYIADKPEPVTITFNSDDPGVDGADTFESGTAEVTHFLRFIGFETGPDTEWGTAFIGDRYREVLTGGDPTDQYGTHEVTFPKEIAPLALDLSLFGTSTARFNNVAFPAGFATDSVGQPFVAFRVRNVVPFAQQYIEWGDTEIDLWQKYLQVVHPPESNADGELFGAFTEVRNRNRIIGVYGLLATRFASTPAYLELTGRAIQPPSINDGEFGAGTFISYRVRNVRVFGYDLDRYPNNTYAYNTAATIRMDGFGTLGFGAHLVDRRLKYLTLSGHRADAYGQAWVSDSPRSVRPVGSDLGGRSNAHYVSHSPYLVQFAGFDNLRLGPPFLFIRPPITVYASWGQLWVQDQKQMGIPKVRRYPPIIEVPGRPYTEFSYPAAFVSHYTRTVRPATVDGQERWGTNVVRDRKFTVRVDGVRTDGYHTFRVENTLPDPVIPRTEYLSFNGGGLMTEWGVAWMDLRWLVVPSVGSTAQFGAPICQSNTIIFATRHHSSASQGDTTFGLPVIPGGVLTVTMHGGDPEYGPGHPRISPLHVYCTTGDRIPRNYKENFHYQTGSMEWDVTQEGGPDRFLNGVIGAPRVLSLRPQTVRSFYREDVPNDNTTPRFGTPWLTKRIQEIYPSSFTPFRSGTSELHPYTQYLGPKGRSMLAMGNFYIPAAAVGEPFIYAGGFDAFVSGSTEVTERDRRVFMSGALHEVLSSSELNPSYNSLNYPIVGDWLRIYPSFDAALFGIANVMHWIRYVEPEPIEGRFGVIRLVRETQTLYVKGDEQTEFGVFDNTRDMIIRPYSVQFLCPTSPFTQVMHA